jgi:uncharacterized Zn-binding protein involved in type VI secretion
MHAGRTKMVLRMAWLLVAVAVAMLTLLAMEGTGAESSAPPEPSGVELEADLAHSFSFNQSDVVNSSDGTATIRTGDASATGVRSINNIFQRANLSGFDGISIVNQDANVSISGTAVANTGGNTAIGNSSTNTASSSSNAP